MRVPAPQRGYLRTSGYYGRFAGRNAEYKFKDTTNALTTAATTGTFLPTTGSILTIAQGNTESQRIGRKVVVKKINMQIQVELPETTGSSATSDIVRMIVYLDKQCNGAIATTTGILESADLFSFRNLANSGRFSILMDKRWAVSCMAGAYDGANDNYGKVRAYKSFSKSCNIPIEYDNSVTTGAITSMRSNNIGVLLFSEGGLMKVGYVVRVRYSDSS